MFEVTSLDVEGPLLLDRPIATDRRGSFRKLVHADAFAELGLSAELPEQYVSVSEPGVVRGMHFQAPPHDHHKLVSVLSGRILDVVVDLRPGPGYGRFASVELSGDVGRSLWIPSGFAHGFLTLERAMVLYDVGSVHAPDHDLGIAWDGFGFAWPIETPILSDRDRTFPKLSDFVTPFAPAPSGRGSSLQPPRVRS